MHRRHPAVEDPQEHRVEQLAAYLLPHEAPYAHAAQRHTDSDHAARAGRYQRHLGLRLEVHASGERRPLDYRRRVDDDYHRHRPDQRHEFRLVQKPAYRPRRDRHDHRQKQAQHHVENEGRAVVHLPGVLLPYQRVREPAVDYAVEDRDYDEDIAYQTVLLRGKQTGKDKPHEKGYALACDIVDAAPDCTPYRLFLQRFRH